VVATFSCNVAEATKRRPRNGAGDARHIGIGGNMAAYAVFIRDSTQDARGMETYLQKAPGTFAGHPVRVLSKYQRHEVLEGPDPEGIVLLEFPSMDEARAWYNSADYQEALKLRLKAANYRAILCEGTP
jgi:uncharacterized protein (DUF1330 family)